MKQYVCPRGRFDWQCRESKWFVRPSDGGGERSKGVDEAVRLLKKPVRLTASRVEMVHPAY
ncbi:hypothetical protein LQV63_06590 [Paenibacillus profundus]|uniref:DUF2188 domain-containing protein n=1 Tax=Paenibacillus profundus TaxID=1173085 RepID=A0ABS8YF55_9BACL|nr:hypothetical protein [Paenibacillus profundus]MCE5168975.1 hypothetical protein [Paenibacillus profundus]